MSTVRAHDDHHAVTDAPLVPQRYYVQSAPLQALLVSFMTRWERERPMVRADRNEDGRWSGAATSSFVSAVDYLVGETGLSRRMIQRLATGEMTMASECVADALCAALGCPEAFHDGTLQVGIRRAGQFVPLND